MAGSPVRPGTSRFAPLRSPAIVAGLMRAPALVLIAACLLGCPRRQPVAPGTTAAPARGNGAAALANPAAKVTSVARPAVVETVLPGLGPISPLDEPGPRALLSLSEPAQGVLEHGADRDSFALYLPAGHSLTLEAHCCGEVLLELRDPAGRTLAEGSRSLQASIAQAGTYSVTASALAGQGLHYTLVAR